MDDVNLKNLDATLIYNLRNILLRTDSEKFNDQEIGNDLFINLEIKLIQVQKKEMFFFADL